MLATRGFSRNARRVLTGICFGSLALNVGCYTYLPVQSQPPQVTERVSLTINDRGRVLLADKIGPILDRVEGRMISIDSTNVVLSVTRVINLRGVASNWVGEEVTVPREGILGFQPRPFSKRKTVFLVGAIVGGILAFALSLSLAVSGSGVKDGDGGTSGQS